MICVILSLFCSVEVQTHFRHAMIAAPGLLDLIKSGSHFHSGNSFSKPCGNKRYFIGFGFTGNQETANLWKYSLDFHIAQ